MCIRDSLITANSHKGAHVRDLGFDRKKGVRTFEVTLANPIKSGEEVAVASFNFGDGNTSEGRIHNYITATQTGRLDGDESDDNDQDVDSREATVSDFGRKLDGTF